jgi:hypothetical protein
MTRFQIDDPSIESQWRALILFGKNSATYKFAFAKALLQFVDQQRSVISLEELAGPFLKETIEHLKRTDKQGTSASSKFLDGCRNYISGKISEDTLLNITVKDGFKYVVDAFQYINGGTIPDKFYEKDFAQGKRNIVLTDNLLRISELFQFRNLNQEVEARWSLVETAWNLQINPNLLEVRHDQDRSIFFVENNLMRRTDITPVRDALNGYQKGKCFYSFQDISIRSNDTNTCAVDHFLPHVNKLFHSQNGTNINGVWNLVLAEKSINGEKSSKIPERRFLERLYNRNEFFIESKHPLAETIVNQTGQTKALRRNFLQSQYNLAFELSIQRWTPSIELNPIF